MTHCDFTHQLDATSWVESAQGSEFPIQNLPYGVCSKHGIVIAIGSYALHVQRAIETGVLDVTGEIACALSSSNLNDFMSLGKESWTAARHAIFNLLSSESESRDALLVSQGELELILPATIGDYTDFYAARNHATNVGKMFRPDGNPLMPNYLHLPVGYHGRASSVVVSGTDIRRPHGQLKPDDADPVFGPCRLLDYELEFGAFIGSGNALGDRITMDEAMDKLFGIVILNDWSARDIQKWEYQPLGPFNAKNFATTISPWIVTVDALAPFRSSGPMRFEGDPEMLDYLKPVTDDVLDVQCSVSISSSSMRDKGMDAQKLTQSTLSHLTWTFAQMLVHHTSTGCPMNSGDLIGSGTISGETKDSRGCLLELTWRGTEPVELVDGSERKFLQDGDELTINAWCERDGAVRIGFGACTGVVTPAQ